MTLESHTLHDTLGARIDGLGLGQPIDNALFVEILAQFRRHALLLFPGQDLTDEQQIVFSERFGPLEITKTGSDGAGTRQVRLTNIGPDGAVLPSDHRQNLIGRANRLWHADSSFKPVPAGPSILSAREVPAHGGNTEFINMRAVYAALPAGLKAKVEYRVAVHDFAHSRAQVNTGLMTDAERAEVPPVRQALVLDHGSKLGRSLYIGSHVSHIEGLCAADSDRLIDSLMGFATQAQFIYSHRWQRHDLVMWDNRCVIHRGTPYDDDREHRCLVRTTVAGTAPTLPER